MSGPKVSVYRLDRRARQLISEQVQCEQESLICVEQIKTILDWCAKAGRELDSSLAVLEALQADGDYETAINEIKALQKSYKQEVEKLREELKKNCPNISSNHTATQSALDKKRKELGRIKQVKRSAQELQNKVNKAITSGKNAAEEQKKKSQQTISEYLNEKPTESNAQLDKEEVQLTKTDIAECVSSVSSFEIYENDDELGDKKKALKRELLTLHELDLSADLYDRIKGAVATLEGIEQISIFKNFYSITVKNLYRDIDEYGRKKEEEKARYEELTIRYKTLCNLVGNGLDVDREFSNVEELETTINELEALIMEQEEQEYIAECVDEVMTEMGYDLIGKRDVKKKSGKHFRNELYSFSDGTAVNITYSQEGQISMELGGLAREDRLPTDDEATALTQDMESFCDEFSEFERRMAEKGIIVGNRIAIMPPSTEYATIINVNDYEIEPGKQVSEISVSGSRKKPTFSQKALRKDE